MQQDLQQGAGMDDDLTVEVMAVEALGESEWAVWRAMVAGNPDLASPYFHPRFTRIAARHSPNSAVAVFHRGGTIAGFFPFQRRGAAVQPLGAPMNDYHGVIAPRASAPDAQAVAGRLKARRFSFGAWVGDAPGMIERDCLMTTLPDDGYDAWYAERRRNYGKYFKDKERARRSLETDLGPLRADMNVSDPALLDRLIDLKRAQYRRTGRHDVFGCGWTRDLLHALVAEGDGAFGATIATLKGGDTLAALELSLYAGDRYHFWFPAYEQVAARCSPGILLSMDTMRLKSAEGFRVFDYGFGGESYKRYFCNTVQGVREGVILKPGLGAAMSQTAVAMLNGVGKGRGEQLRDSVRRRWGAIEACEVNALDRWCGVAGAVGAALNKITRSNTVEAS